MPDELAVFGEEVVKIIKKNNSAELDGLVSWIIS
jgi:hypothetical protein